MVSAGFLKLYCYTVVYAVFHVPFPTFNDSFADEMVQCLFDSLAGVLLRPFRVSDTSFAVNGFELD